MFSKEDIQSKTRSILADILSVDPNAPIEFCIDTIDDWDSLAHLTIISSLSTIFDIEIPVHISVSLLSESVINEYLVSKLLQS